jgi:hypothetical protein
MNASPTAVASNVCFMTVPFLPPREANAAPLATVPAGAQHFKRRRRSDFRSRTRATSMGSSTARELGATLITRDRALLDYGGQGHVAVVEC